MNKIAEANHPMAKVSLKDSVIIFKNIKNKQTEKAKEFLNKLLKREVSIDGRYYDETTREILSLIRDVENNAEAKGLNTDKLYIKEGIVGKQFRFMLPKSRYSHRGKEAKICRLNMKVEER